MENLALKRKLSVLWLIAEATGILMATLAVFTPGVIDDIIAAEYGGIQITSELMLVLAIIYLVPLIGALLSLMLKDSTNRWANIILGIIYTVLALLDLNTCLAEARGFWNTAGNGTSYSSITNCPVCIQVA